MIIFNQLLVSIMFIIFIIFSFKNYSGNLAYYYLWVLVSVIIFTPSLLSIYKNRRHEAAINGDIIKIKKYLKQGVDINIRDSINLTFLHEAAKAGHQKLVLFLIENRADINAKDRD